MNPEEERTPLSDQEKIRLKRIAKLSQPFTNSSTPSTPSPPRTELPQKAPLRPVGTASSSPKAPVPSTPNAVAPPKPITVHPAGYSARFPESFEEWEDKTVGKVLQATLDSDQAEASSWSVTYLKELAEEIIVEEPGLSTPLKLKTDWVDRLLLTRLSLSSETQSEDPEVITVLASLPSNETNFEYLGGCWKRERSERHKLVIRKGAAATEVGKRVEVLNKIKALVISYLGLVLMDPSMFPQEDLIGKQQGPQELLPLLLSSSTIFPAHQLQPSDIPNLFADLCVRFVPSALNDFEGGLEEIVGPIFLHCGSEVLRNKLDIGGGGTGGIAWRDYLSVVQNLVEIKGVASVLPDVKAWDMVGTMMVTVPMIELTSMLGPFLRLSTFPDSFPSIASAYFPDPTAMSRGDVESASTSLRGTLRGVQVTLFQIMNNIVRAGPKSREGVLSFLGHVAKANAKRAAMRVERDTTSSHGFMINLHTILLSFAGPFMDSQYSKIDKIDPLYYRTSERINIAEDTKMSATQVESDAYYARDASNPPPPPNFISEVFFLCCTYLHLGPMHTIKEHKSIQQQLSHMAREIADIEADTTWRGTPQETTTQAHLDRYKKSKEVWNSRLHAFEVQILDPEYLSRCVGFINLVMAWLVRLVDPKKQHPAVPVSLPLPETTPEVFRMLPEYLIEDITEFLSFVSRYAPQVLAENSQDELMSFMLVFLSTPYMKNPYLKGQFVEIMYYLTRPMSRYPRGPLGDVLNCHPLALTNLMPCLVHAYIEIEKSGSHTQFYDKFNTRYYITQLFKLVWSNPTHREALQRETRINLDRYVRFSNLLMNDTTYLLDDAIAHLGKIHDIQKQMDDKETWEAKPASERQEEEKLLRQYESTAKSDLDLGHESLRLIVRFTAETREPFLTPEIVDRLAAMLDMNLSMLAGPRCQDLKVREPQKYKFSPHELLSDVLQVYLELGPRVEFQQAVAKDGRSYSAELFERADRFARKLALKTDDELAVIKDMVKKVEALKAEEEEDDAMGEVPDEFLDPLTYEIMRDPVLLPSSRTVVDRSTIKQHLLSDATDPFNRLPLVLEDIVDAVELKEKIVAFLEQRQRNRTAGAAVPPSPSVGMDIDG